MNTQTLSNLDLCKVIIGESASKLAAFEEMELYGAEYPNEFKKYGLTQKQSEKLLAAIEIGRRIAAGSAARKKDLSYPEKAANYLIPLLRHKKVEEFFVCCLNAKNELIKADTVCKGTLDHVLAHPREIFRFAMLNNAAKIIVAHNHPSGNTKPSSEDVALTKRLFTAGKTIGLPVVDHIIVGDAKYFSFSENHMI